MISDKEHRDVAERLRVEANYWRDYRNDEDISCMSDQQFTEGALTAFGFEDMGMPVYELFDYLADLVDRPTCEYVPIGNGRFGCSWCGYVVKLDYDVPVADETHMPFNYCPNCSAEVLEDV